MTSKTSDAVVNNDELEDGEIEDDLEEFNEFESLFQTAEPSISTASRPKTKTKRSNARRENDRGTYVRIRSHSSRISHRRDRSKSPSKIKNHGGVSSKRRTSPVPSKRSHSNRRRSNDVVVLDVAKGLRQKAESRLRRRKRENSPPKTTMRDLLHQRYPAHGPVASHRKKQRNATIMEHYEQLLQKHREIQEAIQREKSDVLQLINYPESVDVRDHKQISRSQKRTGSQTESLDHACHKETTDEIAPNDSDDEMDELQLRMIALKSATKAVAAREEKENKEELLKMTGKASNFLPQNTKLSRRARQQERKQKLQKWKKQHTLTVEINKATDEKGRYDLFMGHVNRSPDGGYKPPSPHISHQERSTLQPIALSHLDNDSDSDVQEIPITPPALESKDDIFLSDDDDEIPTKPPAEEVKEVVFQADNYEAVEMELDTEESVVTPPIPGVSDGPQFVPLLTNRIQKPTQERSAEESQIFAKYQQQESKQEGDEEDDDDDDDEAMMRQHLLQSLLSNRAAKAQQKKERVEVKAANSQPSALPTEEPAKILHYKAHNSPQMSSGSVSPVINTALKQLRHAATAKSKPPKKPKIPVHKPVIIRPGDDSESSDDERNAGSETSTSRVPSGLSGIDMFLKEARRTADNVKSTVTNSNHSKKTTVKPKTPEAMSKLPDVHRAEYHRLRQEIVRLEQQKQSSSRPGSGTASPDPNAVGIPVSKSLQVTVKSDSKSAAASPERVEVRLVTVDAKKPAKQQQPMVAQDIMQGVCLSTGALQKSNDEDAKVREQQRQETLLREQAQKKAIKECQEKMLKHKQAIQKGHKLLHSLDIQVNRKHNIATLMEGRVNKLEEELMAAQKMITLHNAQCIKFEEQKQQVKIRLEKHILEEKQLRMKLAAVKGQPVGEVNYSATSSQKTGNALKMKIVGAKRPLEASGNTSAATNKKTKVQGGSVSTAAKNSKPKPESKLQELQKLERAYAQKIEQLRETQAKQAQVKMSHLSPAASRLMRTRKCTPNIKPARQVYLKDKIALGNGTTSSGDEGSVNYKRRKSWLDGQNPTLKPNLLESGKPAITPKSLMSSKSAMSRRPSHPSSPIPKRHIGTKKTSNGSADKRITSPSKEGRKHEKAGKVPPEPIVEGLYMPNSQQLKLLQQIQAEKSQKGINFLALAQCFDALQRQFVKEDNADGFELKSAAQKKEGADLHEDVAEEFTLKTYTSPLILFKAYRLSPHFTTGCHMARHSNTVSNKINPNKPFCKYELNGKCNDEECPWQHERDYLLKELELYEDLSSYMQLRQPTNTSSESKTSSAKKIEKEFEKMKRLIEKEKDSGKIDVQQRKTEMGKVCVERVKKHLQNKGISVLLEPRKRPNTYLKSSSRGEHPDTYALPQVPHPKPVSKPDSLCLEDTERYFFGTSEGVVDLEAAVLERPKDIQLWLKLAYKQLADDSNETSLDKALCALSRGLESNRNSSELWLHYLNLYERRDKHPDLLQLCQQAVQFAPDYELWWKTLGEDFSKKRQILPALLSLKCAAYLLPQAHPSYERKTDLAIELNLQYLTLKPSFSEKDAECEKLLEFVKEHQKEEKTALGSHRLVETLLHRVQIHITTRRIHQAINIFQDALREYSITSLTRHLLPADRCLAWLAYLYVMGFHCLPPSLFDPATGALGRLVCKEPFMFPWEQAESSRLSESLITGFQDALLSCSSSQLPIEESIQICLPIYRNLFTMEAKLDRLSKAQSVCCHLLHDCPSSSQLWLCLVDIEKRNNSSVEITATVFKEALTGCPLTAELHYCAAKFELESGQQESAVQYLKQCVIRYYDIDTSIADMNTLYVVNLYKALLDQHLPYDYRPPALATGITSEVVQHNLLHLWCCYCLYLDKLQGHEAALEAYETALCALKATRDVQTLWMQYLEHIKSQISSSGDKATQSWQVFTNVVNRCLISMPTVWPLPHSFTVTWLDYSFHNRVLELYFDCVRREDAGDTFEIYLNKMPHNISLAFRACQHAIEVGSEFQAQLIATAVLSCHSTCVPVWKIAIALCVKNGQTKEAHQMYQQAVEACPLSASLWKDYLLFEVTRGKGRDELKSLILRCRDDIGLNISDYLATIFKT